MNKNNSIKFILFFVLIITLFAFLQNRNLKEEVVGEVISVKGHGGRSTIKYKFKVGNTVYNDEGTVPQSGCFEGECEGYSCLIRYNPEDPNDNQILEVIFD